MVGFDQMMAVVVVFVLRLGIPLLITIMLVRWLRYLDEKWQAEYEAEKLQESAKAQTAVAVDPAPEPAVWPALAADGFPKCWDYKQCDPDKREQCPAYKISGIPCWLARRREEGAIPADCYQCGLFTDYEWPDHPQPYQ